MTEPFFRIARRDEAETILALYKAVVGMPFCTWDEVYPGMSEIRRDLAAGDLFVLEADGDIIGAVSIAPENELDAPGRWSACEKAGEFARVVIRPTFQGRRLARMLVAGVLDEMKKRGCDAVHISVAAENVPAQRTYRHFGFAVVGREEMWGHSFDLCERRIRSEESTDR